MVSAHVDRFAAERLPAREAWPEFRFDVPELRYPARLNAAVQLVDCAVEEGHGDRLALVSEGARCSYAELKDRSDRIARVIADDGLIPGGRVLLRGPNSAMLFAAWAGVLKAGGIAVTTMPMLRAGELAVIAERARVGHAIVDARTLADWNAAESGARTLTYDGDAGTGALETRMAAAPPGFGAIDTAADDIALIAFTSGTTGVPKGCVHFHRDVLIPADAFARHILSPTPEDVFLGSAPIAFTFGLGANLIFPWAARGTAVVVEKPTPEALLAAVASERVTMLFTAPTAYKAMLPLLPGHDLSSLRTCVSAGEPLPAAVSDAWFAATGLRLVDGIGATEMMHIFVSAPAREARAGATGRAVPGYEACVLDADDRPMREGVGRLAVRGPTGCRYLDDARQADYVVGGWNVTGDTFRLDADGWFWFVARSDDMIVSSGYNIAGPEVEAALYSHPAVRECAVVGEPCAERGRVVAAYVVAADGHLAGDALAGALQDHVKATIAPYKYPRRVVFVDALPKTHSGKIKRFALRGPVTDLARALADARRSGAALTEPPPPPLLTLAQGYAVAERVVALLGTPVGWKIGATSAGAMAVLGVAEPIRGRVLADGLLESGVVFDPGARPVAVEPEIVLYPGADGRAVRARLALEIVRPSRDEALALGPGFIVADNAAHVALVLGPELPVEALDMALPVTLRVDSTARETGDTAAVLGDPRAALAWLAEAVGPALGDGPVATGAITRAVQIEPGGEVVGDFGAFGRVSVRIAD